MKEIIAKITETVLVDFGLEFVLEIDFIFIFYILLFLSLLFIIYSFSWRMLSYYSRLMDSCIMEIWEKEENTITKEHVSNEVAKIRLKRLKDKNHEKIKKIRKKRDLIFKVVPFMRWIYKRKKGKNAPLYTLP
jgi:hypothetical protein